MRHEGKHMQHQPARLNSSCPRGRPLSTLRRAPAARLLGLLGLLWPLGLLEVLWLLVLLLLLIRGMSICTPAAPTTSVLGATTTRASAILPPATTTSQEGPSSAQSSSPSASQVPTCKLGPSGARMVSMSSLALAQMPRQEAPSYSCSRSPGPQ